MSGSCTVEIAAFNEFSNFITDEKAQEEYDHIIFDTAPTGHTLLLLDSTQSYHREVKRTQGDIPKSVKKLLPRLRNAEETEVIIVTLAETTNAMLRAKASHEIEWINKVDEHADGNFAVIRWSVEEIKGDKLLNL